MLHRDAERVTAVWILAAFLLFMVVMACSAIGDTPTSLHDQMLGPRAAGRVYRSGRDVGTGGPVPVKNTGQLSTAEGEPSARERAETRGEPIDLQSTSADLILAARICYLEATWRRTDCAAMIGVAKRQAKRTGAHWLDALNGLSVLRLGATHRAREVAAYPWGDVSGKSEVFNARWRALRQFVAEAARGEHVDPCAGSRWWGGGMDVPRGKMIRVECAKPTVNAFYAAGAR